MTARTYKCAYCEARTTNTYRLCDPCRVERRNAEREAQGLPRDLPPEALARIARIIEAGAGRTPQQAAS